MRDEAHYHGDGEDAGGDEQGEDGGEHGRNDDLDGWDVLEQVELRAAQVAARRRSNEGGAGKRGDAGEDEGGKHEPCQDGAAEDAQAEGGGVDDGLL